MVTFAELDLVRRRSATARKALAGPETPLINNAWYVAATSEAIGREVFARTILGRSVVMYRTEAGEVVALQNRCGHRSFPLSHGTLEGDTLTCRYHGLKYGADGGCVALPDGSAPRGKMGVQRFITVERGPVIWIWMGDPKIAETTPLPHPEWLGHPDWDVCIGYAEAKGNYVHLHENLLDLSHLTYLHAKSFGTPEYARAPVEIAIEGDDIQAWRNVECFLPDLYAKPLGWQGQRAIRRSGSQLVSPGLHVNTGIFENLELAEQPKPQPMVKVAQLITPETQHSTHYHYALCRNFARNDDAISTQMLAGMSNAFSEDLYALENQTLMQAESNEAGDFYEFDIPTDRAGLEMRRLFKQRADAEAAPRAAKEK